VQCKPLCELLAPAGLRKSGRFDYVCGLCITRACDHELIRFLRDRQSHPITSRWIGQLQQGFPVLCHTQDGSVIPAAVFRVNAQAGESCAWRNGKMHRFPSVQVLQSKCCCTVVLNA
jgi:hypothetical protein